MLPETTSLRDGMTLRLAQADDAAALREAYLENRDHLEHWETRQDDEYFTLAGQQRRLDMQLRRHKAGGMMPWLVADGDRVVGAVTLSGIMRGPFSNGYVGYWIAASHQGRGLGTEALRAACDISATTLGLHRIEAATLPENIRSQRLLLRVGFTHIGTAQDYLHINGRWQDHLLYQRILHDEPPVL